MKKEIHKDTLNTVGCAILFLAVVSAFYWLWLQAQPEAVSDITIDQKYQKVQISNLQTDAKTLLNSRNNYGNLPVEAPTSDKIGKTNPFAGI